MVEVTGSSPVKRTISFPRKLLSHAFGCSARFASAAPIRSRILRGKEMVYVWISRARRGRFLGSLSLSGLRLWRRLCRSS
jgi:hypothetical protein